MKPEIPGMIDSITSTEAFDLTSFPERIIILGGGYIAVEFAGIFNKLGSNVTEVIRAPQVLRGFDHDVRHHLQEDMVRQGIRVKSEVTVRGVSKTDDVYRVELSDGDIVEADELLCAMGRNPNTSTLGLDDVGIKKSDNGAIKVDRWSRTSVDNIYAAGWTGRWGNHSGSGNSY